MIHRAQNNDCKARDTLVLSNLGIIIGFVLKYRGKFRDLDDIYQEGVLGFLHAIRKYDFEKSNGSRLSTYASLWVKLYIQRFIVYNRFIVKMGTNALTRQSFYQLIQIMDELDKGEVKENKYELLADKFKCSEFQVGELINLLSNSDVPIDGFSDDTTLFLASDVDVEKDIIQRDNIENLRKCSIVFKESISKRDRFIFDSRFLSDNPLTLRDIASKIGISFERVRQIENVLFDDFKEYVLTDKLRGRIRRKK